MAILRRIRRKVISLRAGNSYFQVMKQNLTPLFCAACLIAAAPAAAEVPRQSDIFRAELRPGWRTEDGRHMAALQIDLAPEWKTYWRRPGDAGIPPEFDWSGSENLAALQILWPGPELFDFQGMQTIGYRHQMILPVEIVPADPAQPVDLRATVDLGLCRDICIPASISLSAALSATPGQRPDMVIARALDALPLSAATAGLSDLRCRVEPISDGLRVTAEFDLAPGFGDETVVMEPLRPAWVSDAMVQRQGKHLVAMSDVVPGRGTAYELDAEKLRLTVISAGRVVEVTGCPVN